MPDAYICRRLRRTKITRKASDAAEYIELFGSFTQYQSSCTTTHISEDVQRITLNASCMTISGGRTERLDIFCRVTGFTSDFLSFIVVELIRFFHGAIQFIFNSRHHCHCFCHSNSHKSFSSIYYNPHHWILSAIIHILVHNLFPCSPGPNSLSGSINLHRNTIFHPIIIILS